MITPEQMARAGSEHAHQSALFCWAALPESKALYPELALMFAIPNGGERNRIVAAKLKAEGVKAGTWDIFLPIPSGKWHGLFLEMKRKPNRLTVQQDSFGRAVFSLGYYCDVCYSWEAARDCILRYLNATQESGRT